MALFSKPTTEHRVLLVRTNGLNFVRVVPIGAESTEQSIETTRISGAVDTERVLFKKTGETIDGKKVFREAAR